MPETYPLGPDRRNYTLPRDNDGQVTRFAWPGGYRVWYYCADGGTLCAECVRENLALIEEERWEATQSVYGHYHASEWNVVGHMTEGDMDDPDEELCDHCGRNGTDLDATATWDHNPLP